MTKKTTKKKTTRTTAAPSAERYKGERLATARRIAREAVKKHPWGVLSLPGVGQPRNPSADVWILSAGDVGRVVLGLSDEGKSWIAKRADHSEGYEGEPLFGPGAYRLDPALVTPLVRGLKAAGLTVTP